VQLYYQARKITCNIRLASKKQQIPGWTEHLISPIPEFLRHCCAIISKLVQYIITVRSRPYEPEVIKVQKSRRKKKRVKICMRAYYIQALKYVSEYAKQF
jgi:hypothetical protein